MLNKLIKPKTRDEVQSKINEIIRDMAELQFGDIINRLSDYDNGRAKGLHCMYILEKIKQTYPKLFFEILKDYINERFSNICESYFNDDKKHFSEHEFEKIKINSFNFPLCLIDDNDSIIEINEVVSIGGMADNKGLPTSINIYNHKKNKPIERLSYKLIEQKTL